MNADERIVETTEICKTFHGGVVALDRFTLSVRRGEVVVIIGPSGSGKSTFLRCLNGLEEIDSGSIVIDGIPLDHHRKNRLQIRREVGMVFQSFNLFPHMTVRENIDLAQIRVRKRSREEAAGVTMGLLAKVGISEKADRLPHELSGGQQQRVAIARALVNDPPVILADEPTGNLDTATGFTVMQLLSDLHNDGRTVVVVTHDPRMARFATRMIYILDGRLVSKEDYDQAIATQE